MFTKIWKCISNYLTPLSVLYVCCKCYIAICLAYLANIFLLILIVPSTLPAIVLVSVSPLWGVCLILSYQPKRNIYSSQKRHNTSLLRVLHYETSVKMLKWYLACEVRHLPAAPLLWKVNAASRSLFQTHDLPSLPLSQITTFRPKWVDDYICFVKWIKRHSFPQSVFLKQLNWIML